MLDRRKTLEFTFKAVTNATAMFVVAIIIFIIGLIVVKGSEHISWEFLTANPTGDMEHGGIWPMIKGTAMLVMMMSMFTVPLGAVIAIYLNEVSRKNWFYNAVMSSVRTLAAVPSIVYGLFGLAFFVTVVGGTLDWLIGYEDNVFKERCLLWAAFTMGSLTLPTNVISVTEALRLVPDEQRHAGICIGYTRWEVIKWVVLPQAIGGMLTGLVLSISRGAGEVAPILFVGVAYFVPNFTGDPLDQFMELGYHIFVMATQSPNVDRATPILYSTTLVLLTLTFTFNSIGQILRWIHRRKMDR
ncbi:Phosphate transport system permease protein PstA (TC 3.A.1.7.1) [hydrothermal vent metagenome]|uniref:Phosphate transport system permease protein PstA (TC 3.A.1.7.1) n=1 Tax=hydrothermal vent metagenome TaxID=652676 RepID=A0A3B1CWA9_9ZZZZ